MSQVSGGSSGGGGSGTVAYLQGNTGGDVPPNGSGEIFVVGTGSITIPGNAGTNTLTVELTGLTEYNILAGAGTATVDLIAPSSSTGVPLVSGGSSAYPSFSGNVDNTIIGANTAAAGTFTYLTATQRIIPSSNVQSLSGTKTIGATDPQYQFLNPNGASRTVVMPTNATNMLFIVSNVGSGGYVLNVTDASSNALATIANNVTAGFYYNGSAWVLV